MVEAKDYKSFLFRPRRLVNQSIQLSENLLAEYSELIQLKCHKMIAVAMNTRNVLETYL